MTITYKNFGGVFDGTVEQSCRNRSCRDSILRAFVGEARGTREACRYNLALQTIVQNFLTPTNQYLESERAVETGEDRQGEGEASAVQRGAIAPYCAAFC